MKKIYLLAFRGTGGFDNEAYKDNSGLSKAGHVALQLEGDKRIFGFHPSPEAEIKAGGGEKLLALLLKHIPQEGLVQEDTEYFLEAYKLWDNGNGERTKVVYITYEVTEVRFQEIQNSLLGWYNKKTIFMYNLPQEDGTFGENEYNCATFPKLLDLQVPHDSGILARYIKEMVKQLGAVVWHPEQ